MKHEMKEKLQQYQQFIESYMDENCFQYDSEPQKILFDAMRYSLLAGGKRLRPVFVLDFCSMCGGDWHQAASFAAAIFAVASASSSIVKASVAI
jgi:geranylgeranyl diphosphate synthase type II